MTARRAAVWAEVLRVVLGAAQFLLAVRLFGVSQYGVYAQLLAGALLVGPLATGGASFWIQPYVRGGGSVGSCMRSVNAASLLLGLPCALVITGVLNLVSAADWRSLVLLAVVECALTPAWMNLCLIDLAQDRGGAYLGSTLALLTSKVVATAVALLIAPADLALFGAIQLAILAPIYLVCSYRFTGMRLLGLRTLGAQRVAAYQRGSVGLLSGVASQADKLLLSAVLPAAGVSELLAANRMATYAQTAGRAWLLHAFPYHFEHVRDLGAGVAARRAVRLGIQSSASVVVLGLAAVVGLLLIGSHLFPGLDLVPTTLVLLLAAMLRMLHYALGDLLYAFDAANTRLLSILLVSGVYLVTLFIVGPELGVVGVAWLSTGAEAALLVLFTGFVWRAIRDRPDASPGQVRQAD